jgi:hypothetical protein
VFKVIRELKVFLGKKVIKVMMEVQLVFRVLLQHLPIYQQKETLVVMDISRLIQVTYMFGMVVSGMTLVTLLDLKVYKDYKD